MRELSQSISSCLSDLVSIIMFLKLYSISPIYFNSFTSASTCSLNVPSNFLRLSLPCIRSTNASHSSNESKDSSELPKPPYALRAADPEPPRGAQGGRPELPQFDVRAPLRGRAAGRRRGCARCRRKRPSLECWSNGIARTKHFEHYSIRPPTPY